MEPEQYAIMAGVEDRHWWYLGLRDLLVRCWQQPALHLPSHPNVLDAGCGTGGNLRFFRDHLQPRNLSGFDVSPLALEAARQKCPEANLHLADICAPTVEPSSLDLLFSCDVIYVPGLAASRAGLHKLVDGLRPGGQFVLHVPAYNWLKSHHDRAVHTRERFVLSQMNRLLAELGLECQRASYRLCGLLPLITLRRLPELVRPGQGTASQDLALPPAWLNRWLLRLVQWENQRIARGGSWPWGSSIVVIGSKRFAAGAS